MKKIITLFAFITVAGMQAQSPNVATFEGFGLAPASYYTSTLSLPFQDGSASFAHTYSGGFWLGGFSYTNKYDTVNGTYTNLYGIRAYKGAEGSGTYAVGQDKGLITFGVPQTTLNSLYITNTTYAYKTILKGDQYSRKFGDTTGTGSGTTIPQGQYPDYFKVVIRAYLNGAEKNDSVEFYLADYRGNSDFVVDAWQQVNTAALGALDSVRFILRSTDMSFGYMNTPAFFAVDNLFYTTPSSVGLDSETASGLEIFPNPGDGIFNISMDHAGRGTVTVRNLQGLVVYTQTVDETFAAVNLRDMPAGIYFLEFTDAKRTVVKKLLKS